MTKPLEELGLYIKCRQADGREEHVTVLSIRFHRGGFTIRSGLLGGSFIETRGTGLADTMDEHGKKLRQDQIWRRDEPQ